MLREMQQIVASVLRDTPSKRVRKMIMRRQLVCWGTAIVVALSVAVTRADVFNMPAGQTSLSFVPVGDVDNAADPLTTYGSVDHAYRIGAYDVTVGQYCQFLNAVAKTDDYGLYSDQMGWAYPTIKITRSGTSGDYSYSVGGGYSAAANCPIFSVSWASAARFVNWLQNGQPSFPAGTPGEIAGSTETGAYSLNGANDNDSLAMVTRNPDATYFLPSLDEWYKAAYYKGGGKNAGYWLFPTQSNSQPNNVLSETAPNSANYFTCTTCTTDPTNHMSPVGAFAASPGPYGTYDQGGNVNQWNETSLDGSTFNVRGGDWDHFFTDMKSGAHNGDYPPTYISSIVGFRVAGVPEPGSMSLLLVGMLSMLACCWRRRRAA
jgi:formylglycine-generating enzyme